MSRPPRLDLPDSRFHIVNRGVDHGRIFFDDADRTEFVGLLGEIHDRFAVKTLAYCLMDNHYHVLVHCPEAGMSAAFQYLGGTFARHVNERAGRDGHLFGSRFFSAPVTTDRYLLAAIRYVERNALDLPGVRFAAAHRWSSHRANAGYQVGPDWLDTAAVRSYFGDVDRYRRFIDGEGHKAANRHIDVELLDQVISAAIAVHRPDDLTPQQLDRTIKILLVDRLAAHDGETIIRHLGFRSNDSSGSARRHARRRLTASPQLAALVARTHDLLDEAHGATIPLLAEVYPTRAAG